MLGGGLRESQGRSEMEQKVDDEKVTNALAGEIQLILAEKRTSLSFLRTGITILALPLSVLSALIATSRLYDFATVKHLLIPLFVICVILVAIGSLLIVRAVVRVRHFDRAVGEIKKRHSVLRDFLD